jgi:oligopeptide/dipeptide ABC transporter ATP-binding protein
MTPRLQVEDLKVHYPLRGGVFRRTVGWLKAVDGVSLDIPAGSTFGLVGESGCGKSSLSRAVLRLQPVTSGRVLFQPAAADTAVEIAGMGEGPLRALRREMQIVFQDPQSALNPRLRIGTILSESLRALEQLTASERQARIADSLAAVGLPEDTASRFPHEFSGGQRQRIAIARALISRPNFIVLDEPVSALDVSVRAQILSLLLELQRSRGLTYLFVSHDLSVVRYVSDRIGVMYLGRMVECGPTERIFTAPLHPYTRQLLAAVPVPKPRARRKAELLQGDPPSPIDLPVGCAFQSRCSMATDLCREKAPLPRDAGGGQLVSCHHA